MIVLVEKKNEMNWSVGVMEYGSLLVGRVSDPARMFQHSSTPTLHCSNIPVFRGACFS